LAGLVQGPRNARERVAHESGDPPLTNPITGVDCCAHDESSYVATANPSAAANFRLADGDIHWKTRHGSQPLINTMVSRFGGDCVSLVTRPLTCPGREIVLQEYRRLAIGDCCRPVDRRGPGRYLGSFRRWCLLGASFAPDRSGPAGCFRQRPFPASREPLRPADKIAFGGS